MNQFEGVIKEDRILLANSVRDQLKRELVSAKYNKILVAEINNKLNSLSAIYNLDDE